MLARDLCDLTSDLIQANSRTDRQTDRQTDGETNPLAGLGGACSADYMVSGHHESLIDHTVLISYRFTRHQITQSITDVLNTYRWGSYWSPHIEKLLGVCIIHINKYKYCFSMETIDLFWLNCCVPIFSLILLGGGILEITV